MKQTEKQEVVNFIQATLADAPSKTGTQLMELFAEHAGIQEYNRKNLKQVFHRVSLSLADEGKIVVTFNLVQRRCYFQSLQKISCRNSISNLLLKAHL